MAASDLVAARFWAAALALGLHNAEEIALDLPGWASSHPELVTLTWSANSAAFTITAVLLVGAAVLFALGAQLRPQRWMSSALRLFAIIMLVNAASHLALSIWTGSVMPGTWTAGLVVLPVFGWLGFAPGTAIKK